MKTLVWEKKKIPLQLKPFYKSHSETARPLVHAGQKNEPRSGEFAGQSSTPTPWSLNQLLVLLAVWAGAKSCSKIVLPVALLSSDACELAPLRIVLLCVFLPIFFIFFYFSFDTCMSAMIMYDRRTLLDIGHRYTNLIKDTLSTDPAWPLEILRSTELNNDHLNNRRRRRKHRGRRAGIRSRLRKRAHSPPLPSILLANVQSLENKMDDLRARISFQRDIRDCNIFCLTETWLTPTVPDTAVTPSDNFSVLRMDRTAEAGKNKGGGVCFFINKKWCDPRNISILSRSCSPHLELSPLSAAPSICPGNLHRSSCLPFIFLHKQTLAWLCQISTMKSADISTNIPTLHASSLGTLTRPTSRKSCRTFINTYPVQPED